MTQPSPSQHFLEALGARHFERLEATLAPDVQARFVLPSGVEEHEGAEAIVRRFRDWFGAASTFDLLASTQVPVGERERLSWRFEVVRDGQNHEVVEQVVYFDLGPRGIEWIDLLCSGFQAAAPVYDAGNLGCADGLAQEFRRRIEGVPVGMSLQVVVADPAAKHDLPSLARLLGQRVAATEPQADGRLLITVERRK